jgi:hypothetical protein
MTHRATLEKKQLKKKAFAKKRVKKITRKQADVTRTQHLNKVVDPDSLFPYKMIACKSTAIAPDDTSSSYINFYAKCFSEPQVFAIKKIYEWACTTGYQLRKNVDDSRGKRDVVSLGTWVEQGQFDIHRTPATLHPDGQIFIDKFSFFWTEVSNIIRRDFPSIIQEMEEMDSNLKLFDLFSLCVINLSSVTKCHRDFNDNHICVVIPISEFDEGKFFSLTSIQP